MSFLSVVLIVAPVFGLIAVGLIAARSGLFKPEVGEALGDFSVTLGIPVLIFRTIGTAHFPDQSPWPLWAAYFGGVLVAWALGSLISGHLFGRTRAEGVIAGTASSFSNLVMVGIPLLVSAYGEAGALPLFIILSIHLPTMMVAGTLMTERAIKLDQGLAEPVHPVKALVNVARNLAFHPIVWGLVAGAVLRVSGLPLAGVPRVMVDQIAAAGLPTALVGLGMALARYGMVSEIRLASLLVALKQILFPGVVYLLARYAFGLNPDWTRVATLAAACPPGVNAYLFAQRFNVAHATASNSIALGTAASIVTMTLWLFVIG